jgi:hypothetical protein
MNKTKTCCNCYWSNTSNSFSGRIVQCTKLHTEVNGKKNRSKCKHWCTSPPIRKDSSYFDLSFLR